MASKRRSRVTVLALLAYVLSGCERPDNSEHGRSTVMPENPRKVQGGSTEVSGNGNSETKLPEGSVSNLFEGGIKAEELDIDLLHSEIRKCGISAVASSLLRALTSGDYTATEKGHLATKLGRAAAAELGLINDRSELLKFVRDFSSSLQKFQLDERDSAVFAFGADAAKNVAFPKAVISDILANGPYEGIKAKKTGNQFLPGIYQRAVMQGDASEILGWAAGSKQEARLGVINKVVRQWSSMSPLEASTYVKTMKSSIERDYAANALVSHLLSTGDIESAVSWGDFIENEELRTRTMRLIEVERK